MQQQLQVINESLQKNRNESEQSTN